MTTPNLEKELLKVLEKMREVDISLQKTHELYFFSREKYLTAEKELELLKEGCDEVLEAFDNHFKKELLAYQGKPYDIHHQEVKQKISKIRKLLQ